MKASVIIPTYNRSATILDTISSVLMQDYAPLEIIVIDDGSDDETAAVISHLIDAGDIILIRQNHSGKPSCGRNRGLQAATGDVVFIFDSDDLMLPSKIKMTMDAFTKVDIDEVGFCCTDFILRRPDESEQSHFARAYYDSFREMPRAVVDNHVYLLAARSAYNALLAANYVGTSSVAFPRAIVDAGFRFDESLTNADDYDLWLRLARIKKVLVISCPLHVYIVHAGGVLTKSIRTGGKWRTHIQLLKRELGYAEDAHTISLARARLSDNYYALLQCDLEGRRWLKAGVSMMYLMRCDLAKLVRWLLRGMAGRLQRTIFR